MVTFKVNYVYESSKNCPSDSTHDPCPYMEGYEIGFDNIFNHADCSRCRHCNSWKPMSKEHYGIPVEIECAYNEHMKW